MGQMFDVGHVAQLHEIQRARLSRGDPGIGSEVEELIARLTSGGVGARSGDLRTIQAKRLWDKGFGREVKAKNFKAYLASIPEIPASLITDDPEFPFLSLVDPCVGLVCACSLASVQHSELGYSDGDIIPFDERHTDPTQPFWVRHDDGRKNRNRRPDHCRDECTGDLLAGTAMVGLFTYIHHQEIVKEGEHILDLPGSIHHDEPLVCAYLGVWDGQPKLSISGDSDRALSDYGSLRFRRK